MIVTTFTVNVVANGNVAKIGTNEYATLATAIDNVNNNDTITMLSDVTIDSEITIPDGKTFTIDLNSKTLTITAATGFSINSANLTVKNGKVKNTDESGINGSSMETRTKAFFLWKDGTGSLTLDNVKVESTGYSVNVDNNNKNNGAKNKKITIKDCDIKSGKWAAVYAGGADGSNELTITNSKIHSSWTGTTMAALQICMKTTLEKTIVTNDYGAALACFENVDLLVKGTENSFSAPKEAIATSGNFQGSKITIEGGTFTSSSDIAAYLPSGDTITIDGGTFTGNTAVAVKGGNVTINGGTFTANGTAANPLTGGSSGAKLTGDAIYVEDNYGNTGNNGAFAHKVILNINGGTFTSQNGYALSARFVDNDDTDPAQIKIKGGLFKSGVEQASIYTGESFEGTITASAGYYSIAPETKYIASDYECINTPTTDEHCESYPYMIGKIEVAKIGDTTYSSLLKAVNSINDNKDTTITMLRDEVAQSSVVIDSNKNIKLDLNGTTYQGSIFLGESSNNDTFTTPGKLKVIDSSVEKTGKIISDPNVDYALFVVGSSKLTLDGVTVENRSSELYHDVLYSLGDRDGSGNKKSDVIPTIVINDSILKSAASTTVSSPTIFCIDGNLTIKGNSQIVSLDGIAVQSLGTFGENNIIIQDNAQITALKTAIYLPHGNLTINGGTIEGATAVWAKGAYKTVVNGGTLIGNGNNVDYVHKGSGIDATGDAFVVEACNFGGYGNPEVWIKGGLFTSEHAEAVAYYIHNEGSENNKIINADEKFISGGWFSNKVPNTTEKDFVVSGYKASDSLKDKGAPNNTNIYTVVKEVPKENLDNKEIGEVEIGEKTIDTTFGTKVTIDETLPVEEKAKISNIQVSNLNKAISTSEKNSTITSAANKAKTAEAPTVEVEVIMNVELAKSNKVESLAEKIEEEKAGEYAPEKVEYIDITIDKIVKANGNVIEVKEIKKSDSYQIISFPIASVLGSGTDKKKVFVYRNHIDENGIETNESLKKVEKDYGPSYSGECYWIDGENIYIKAKNFSIYGFGVQNSEIPAESKPASNPDSKSGYKAPKTGVE